MDKFYAIYGTVPASVEETCRHSCGSTTRHGARATRCQPNELADFEMIQGDSYALAHRAGGGGLIERMVFWQNGTVYGVVNAFCGGV